MAFDLSSATPLVDTPKPIGTPAESAAPTPTPKIPEKDAKPPEAAAPATPGVIPDVAAGGRNAFEKIADLEKQRAEFVPPKPDLPKRPKDMKEGLSMWGGLAIAFAALASAKTRTPLTSAMNAIAAAFKGVQDGNHEAFERSYKEWEADMKLANDSYNAQRTAYEDLMSRIDKREALYEKAGALEDRESQAKLYALTQSFGDVPTWDAYKRGGWPAVADLHKKTAADQKALKEFEEQIKPGAQVGVAMKFLEKDPKYQAALAAGDTQTVIAMRAGIVHQFATKQPSGPTAENAADPATIDDMSDRVGTYEMSWQDAVKGYPTRGGVRAAVQTELFKTLKEKYPDWTPVNEHLIAKDRDTLNTGSVSKNIVALGTLPKHIETLKGLVDQLPDDAGATALTNLFQLFEKQYSPELAQYGVGAKAVSAELAAALAGSARPGITERADNLEDLTSAKSKAMLKAELDEMLSLAGSRADELREQYRRVPDIDSYFPPELLKAYDRKAPTKKKTSAGEGDGAFERISTDGAKPPEPKAPPPAGAEHRVYVPGEKKWYYKVGDKWKPEGE